MSAACNIGSRGVRARWLGGFATLALIGIVFLSSSFWSFHPLWRLVLVLPFFVAFLNIFQAKDKT